jgi:hypothetical protein
MNNIVLDEIELTDAELAAIYGAEDGDDDAVPQPVDTDAEEPVQQAKVARRARTPKTLSVPQEQDSQDVTSEEEKQLINLLLALFVNS